MATYTLPRTPATEQAGEPAQRATNDRDAFAQLYALTIDRVTRYVVVRLRDYDRDAIEDVVQEAFCDALADPALIENDPLGSMLRLAARACTRHQWSRRRYIRAALTVGEHEHNDPTAPDITRLWRTGQAPRITFAHALAQLTPGQRLAIQLRLLDGLPLDEVARFMNRTPVAVRSLERRGLRRLRTEVTATGDHQPGAQHAARTLATA